MNTPHLDAALDDGHFPGHVLAADPSVFGMDYGFLHGWALEYEAAPLAVQTPSIRYEPLLASSGSHAVPTTSAVLLGLGLVVGLLLRRGGRA